MTTALRNHIENLVIGKPKPKVIELLEEREFDYRFIRDDKEHHCITDDLVKNRFNLESDNGIITNITFG